ncbi:hypothetical protein [Halorubrum sp. PV6]|uniref:hypothetical protein n=1 Tax=Halorubrum sp. PV6 TaxID=634157 RepID=UPI000F8F1EF4|nr:hypothetical protein [Halorubrum sp. PV6]
MIVDVWSIVTTSLFRIVASLLATGLVVFFRHRIWRSILRGYHYLFDTRASIKIRRIDRYESDPSKTPDHSVFEDLKSNVDGLKIEGISEDKIRITVPEINATIDVLVERDLDIDPSMAALPGQVGEKVGYKVIVETEPSMSFGYRTYDDLSKFEYISDNIAKQVGKTCFAGDDPTESFVTGELDTRVPIKRHDVNDRELGMRARFEDSTMTFNLDNPNQLTRGIRRYFQPLTLRN